tara:strand:+ start:640 stop:1020 length:381 start_codon:yes stop_codon:yes gene_type:complete
MSKNIGTLPEEVSSAIKTIDVNEAKSLHGKNNIMFLDVRETEELLKTGKIKGAIHIPSGFLEFEIENHLQGSHDSTIIVVCAAGMRSLQAAKVLKDMGISNPLNLKGGMNAWIESGYETEKVEAKF